MEQRKAAAWRVARVERETSESRIALEINLDGTGEARVSTGVPFYDHMLAALSRHSLIDLTVDADGDTDVDVHHTVEDTAICFGRALRDALGTSAASAASARRPSRSTRPWPGPSSTYRAGPTSCTKANPRASSTTSSEATSPGR